MSAINYRITDSLDDMRQAEYLQQAVWGMTPEDTLSATTMRWMIHIGGLLIGAWDKDTMVGFCVASVGKRDGKWVLWSDMAGVHPDYQGHGIGYDLKHHQRKWAQEEGFGEIRWTFDPMRRGNAFFNFHRLGATSRNYHHAFYGEMQDSINRGLPADRLEAIWQITDNPRPKPTIIQDSPLAVSVDDNSVSLKQVDAEQVRIQIPYDLNTLKQNSPHLARQWQDAVREAFTYYFVNGYTAFDFHRENTRCWYILHKII